MDTGVRIGEGQGGGWKLVPLLGVWVPEKYMADSHRWESNRWIWRKKKVKRDP